MELSGALLSSFLPSNDRLRPAAAVCPRSFVSDCRTVGPSVRLERLVLSCRGGLYIRLGSPPLQQILCTRDKCPASYQWLHPFSDPNILILRSVGSGSFENHKNINALKIVLPFLIYESLGIPMRGIRSALALMP